MKSNFNIKEDGRKVWKKIHIESLDTQTPEKKKVFEEFIHNLQKSFDCIECKEHFEDYIEANPVSEAEVFIDEDGNDLTCFLWAWKFHDSVNNRIGKKGWNFKKTLEYYRKYIKRSEDSYQYSCSVQLFKLRREGKIVGKTI